MDWEYQVVRERLCSSCKGNRGWETDSGFQDCHTCEGTGFERQIVSLEDALRMSPTIRKIRDNIAEVMNA